VGLEAKHPRKVESTTPGGGAKVVSKSEDYQYFGR
jgi:hypothetical protein